MKINPKVFKFFDSHITIKFLTSLSIVGAVLVSFNFPLLANIVWSISNPLLAAHNKKINQIEQYHLFCVFSLIAVFGVINIGVKL